ncbi:hypothetical protein INS49_000896 [Diaporthe citri]|uniref:uncharacterized protein n=1 Tax=Diaporthe citri TaxID=83186 RepID=UPI001C7E987B|nr:uncharacterized protein INS49_000896 [Diaporthe citri]KAG6366717.1 hypothetical protein INS49_000896 [Diaporthe citri]
MATTSRAIICTGKGQAAVKEVPVPSIREGHILVKVKAVGLNPTDWKSIHSGDAEGKKIGCDYAGVVEEVGPGVTKPLKKGDRVCGFAHGANDAERGAFGDYILADSDIQLQIPDNVSFEEAATLGVGITTVGQGLYQFLKLPLPSSPLSSPKPILINGGSTATGILGIQFAKLSGLTVLTTASPHNFDYLKSLGADAVFDYHTPAEELAKEIKAQASNHLTLAWDCSPTPESTRVSALAMSDSQPGVYGALLPVKDEALKSANPNVSGGSTMGYTVFGEAFSRHGRDYPAKAEDRKFGTAFWELSGDLLSQGKFKVARTSVNQGGEGLGGVLKGLDDLKEGKVSGTKLVYTL